MQQKNKRQSQIKTELETISAAMQLIDVCNEIPKGELPQRPINEIKQELNRLLLVRFGHYTSTAVMYLMLLLLFINFGKGITGHAVDVIAGWKYLAIEILAGLVVKGTARVTVQTLNNMIKSAKTLMPYLEMYYRTHNNEK